MAGHLITKYKSDDLFRMVTRKNRRKGGANFSSGRAEGSAKAPRLVLDSDAPTQSSSTRPLVLDNLQGLGVSEPPSSAPAESLHEILLEDKIPTLTKEEELAILSEVEEDEDEHLAKKPGKSQVSFNKLPRRGPADDPSSPLKRWRK